jgi:hypothetical protein
VSTIIFINADYFYGFQPSKRENIPCFKSCSAGADPGRASVYNHALIFQLPANHFSFQKNVEFVKNV